MMYNIVCKCKRDKCVVYICVISIQHREYHIVWRIHILYKNTHASNIGIYTTLHTPYRSIKYVPAVALLGQVLGHRQPHLAQLVYSAYMRIQSISIIMCI